MTTMVQRALSIVGLVVAIGSGSALTAAAASAAPVHASDSAVVASEPREFTGSGIGNTRPEAEQRAFDRALSRARTAGYGDCQVVDIVTEPWGSGFRSTVTLSCLPFVL
jgi:hypothetical protein